ncbi:hypothetical protein PoB_004843600 [Plakobranchus ocellatus]|uniref:Uncharacterized protein n=1 Tax=Plakobranchus ocellatus TaxID=259542 RepID=A0AAV4BS89_9GAST|nr:hypothetical protein PoB_004843600 [Plakobranchus ocellatus]
MSEFENISFDPPSKTIFKSSDCNPPRRWSALLGQILRAVSKVAIWPHMGPNLAPPMIVWPRQIVIGPWPQMSAAKLVNHNLHNKSQETGTEDTIVYPNFI